MYNRFFSFFFFFFFLIKLHKIYTSESIIFCDNVRKFHFYNTSTKLTSFENIVKSNQFAQSEHV